MKLYSDREDRREGRKRLCTIIRYEKHNQIAYLKKLIKTTRKQGIVMLVMKLQDIIQSYEASCIVSSSLFSQYF